jgi:hypothetical protein
VGKEWARQGGSGRPRGRDSVERDRARVLAQQLGERRRHKREGKRTHDQHHHHGDQGASRCFFQIVRLVHDTHRVLLSVEAGQPKHQTN